MKILACGLATFFVMLLLGLAMPAQAGRFVLRYEEKGQVSVSIFSDGRGRDVILFRALPLTADRTPGPAVLRLDGVYVAEWEAPAYEFEFDLSERAIPSLDGQLVIPWLKGDKTQKVDLRRLTIGVHTVEVYFASKDDRGRLDRNRTAAPATQFRVEEIDPPTAATTDSGQPLTSSQLDAAIKQGYEKGVSQSKVAWEKEREQLLNELQKATDELNELRRKAALQSTPSSKPVRTSQSLRYLPIKWQDEFPKLGEQLVLIDPKGKIVTTAKVVEIFPEERRIWVSLTLPVEFQIQGHTVRRPRPQEER